jgi:GGDEF domain-containing protein
MGSIFRPGTETGNGEDTEPASGFGTRLMLMADLTVALRVQSPPRMLAIFDLGGFHDYVDLYGRLEGEHLLSRVGDRLAGRMEQPATFYRPRDAEFAAILEIPLDSAGELLAATVLAVTRQFAQFNLALAFGAAMLPVEASEPIDVLMLADERLSLNARTRGSRERRADPHAHRAPGVAL